MKGESNIEELFRQRLYNAEVPPPMDVWPKIEEDIRKPRRHRLFFWMLFFGLGAVGTGLWLSSAQRSKLAIQAAPALRPQEAQSAPGLPPSSAEAQQNTATLATAGTHPTNNDSPVGNTHPSPQNTPKGIATDPGIGAALSIKPLPLPSSKQADIEKNTVQVALALDRAGEMATANPLTLAATASEGASLSLGANDTRLPSLDFIDLESTLKQPWAKKVRIVKKKKEQKKCYDFHKNSTAWFVDAYAGSSLAQKMLSTTPDNLPYLNKRLNTEHRDWAMFNLGVRATYLFKRHFLLRTGLHYDHSTELFRFKELDHIEFKASYNPVTGRTDTTEIDSIFRTTKTFNRFGMLEIPVMAGFELRSGNMGVSVNGGVSMNLLFWKRGQILSPDNKLAWFTPGKPAYLEVFRQHTGLSAMGSVQWFWHMHPHLRMYTELYVRQVLKPISLSTHPIEQRHRAWGLNLGVTRILD